MRYKLFGLHLASDSITPDMFWMKFSGKKYNFEATPKNYLKQPKNEFHKRLILNLGHSNTPHQRTLNYFFRGSMTCQRFDMIGICHTRKCLCCCPRSKAIKSSQTGDQSFSDTFPIKWKFSGFTMEIFLMRLSPSLKSANFTTLETHCT